MSAPRRRRRAAALLAAALVPLALAAACAAPVEDPAGEEGTTDGTIALLLPEAKTARYETTDRPGFTSTVASRCPGCQVLYANADADAATQQEQAESVLARGVDVLVLDAVDTVAARSILVAAERQGVPVIAYDRFLPGADYYVSFDSELIGYLEGVALVAEMEARGPRPDGDPHGVLLVHGSPTDPNAAALAAGVHRALDGEDIEVLAEYDTPDWSPDKAQDWVESKVAQYGTRVDGVFAASDGMAGGAISAMRAGGLTHPVPPVTGQDGELAAVQRVVAGDQYMTVFKATTAQARTAAELAVRVLRGAQPATTAVIEGVPSMILAPSPVTVEDVERVVVQGGVYPLDEICAPAYAAACERAGLLPGGSDGSDGSDGSGGGS